MVKKYAFLFPGQGAQFPGMIRDICDNYSVANECLDEISDITNLDIKKILWESDSQQLSRTDCSQLAITAASLTIAKTLKSFEIEPDLCGGFSLGEFPALYLSGVLSFKDTILVVKRRGEIMQQVCQNIANKSQGVPPGMAAVVGLPPEKVIELCASCNDVYAANMNSQKQTVVSGTAAGLAEMETLCKDAGARRFVPLAVAGPFHSPLMKEAAIQFEKEIEPIQFNDTKTLLLSNVTGGLVTNGNVIKKNVVSHLTKPVLWTKEEDVLGDLIQKENESNSVEWKIFEVGPGKVLSGLWRDTEFNNTIQVQPINTAENIESIVK